MLSSSRALTFTDPHLYQAAILTATGTEILPLAKGEFDAELVQINFSRLRMQRGHESLPRILRGTVPDRTAIEFPTSGSHPFRHNGIDVSLGEVIINDAHPVNRLSFGPCHWGAMSLRAEDLAATGHALIGQELTRPPIAQVMRPPPALMARLLRLHEEAERLAKSAPDRFAHPEVVRSLEDALVHAMVRCVSEGKIIETSSSSRYHASMMSKLEEFLAANCIKPVYLGEICAATGMSESTLRRCCVEHLGMGPIRYLLLRRMHLARMELRRCDAATTTVTDVATACGFWELGRFSVEYKKLFGESPSATLHQTKCEKPTAKNRPSDLFETDFA